MIEVKIEDLKPGDFYLAKDKNFKNARFQGIFEGIYKPGPYRFAQFREAKNTEGKDLPVLWLGELHFIFYEKNAEIMAYTNAFLRNLIGDPDIFYCNFFKQDNFYKKKYNFL